MKSSEQDSRASFLANWFGCCTHYFSLWSAQWQEVITHQLWRWAVMEVILPNGRPENPKLNLASDLNTANRPAVAGNRAVCGWAQSRLPTLCGRQNTKSWRIGVTGRQSKKKKKHSSGNKHTKKWNYKSLHSDKDFNCLQFTLMPFIHTVIHFLSLHKAMYTVATKEGSLLWWCLVWDQNKEQALS